MHIPDGFLDPYMAAATYLAFLGYGGYALRKIRVAGSFGERIP